MCDYYFEMLHKRWSMLYSKGFVCMGSAPPCPNGLICRGGSRTAPKFVGAELAPAQICRGDSRIAQRGIIIGARHRRAQKVLRSRGNSRIAQE